MISSSGYVYLFRLGGFHKIGSSVHPKERMSNYRHLPYECAMVHFFPSERCEEVEKALHRRFDMVRVKGEWFLLSPEDVARIEALGRTDTAADLPDDLRPATASVVACDLVATDSLAHRLRSLREAAGLTQNGLARTSGVCHVTISMIEQGRHPRPSAKVTTSLARALGVTVERLLK